MFIQPTLKHLWSKSQEEGRWQKGTWLSGDNAYQLTPESNEKYHLIRQRPGWIQID